MFENEFTAALLDWIEGSEVASNVEVTELELEDDAFAPWNIL